MPNKRHPTTTDGGNDLPPSILGVTFVPVCCANWKRHLAQSQSEQRVTHDATGRGPVLSWAPSDTLKSSQLRAFLLPDMLRPRTVFRETYAPHPSVRPQPIKRTVAPTSAHGGLAWWRGSGGDSGVGTDASAITIALGLVWLGFAGYSVDNNRHALCPFSVAHTAWKATSLASCLGLSGVVSADEPDGFSRGLEHFADDWQCRSWP